jgi:hypothetical protein
MSSSDNIITIILLAAVAYVLYTMGLLTPKSKTSSAVSQECPRGQLYSRGLFGDCDPNYKMDWLGNSLSDVWSGGNCVCQSKIQKKEQQNISGTAEAASQDRQATKAITGGTIIHTGYPDLVVEPGDFVDPKLIRSGQYIPNTDVPAIASPVIPDSSPMSPGTPDFLTQTGMAISGAFSGLEKWIAGGLGL